MNFSLQLLLSLFNFGKPMQDQHTINIQWLKGKEEHAIKISNHQSSHHILQLANTFSSIATQEKGTGF